MSNSHDQDIYSNNLNQRLKEFFISNREKSGLSQHDVSARSDVFGMGRVLDQRAVSRIENSPINADAIKIAAYLTAIGLEPKKYYEYLMELTVTKKQQITSFSEKPQLSEKIIDLKQKVLSIKEAIKFFDHEYLNQTNLVEDLAGLDSFINTFDRKPIIGCFGNFDAGKSTLINTIIHNPILPTRYQPATSIVNLLMHITDRPESIKSNVLVFKKGFLPFMIHDSVLLEQYLVQEGSYDLLEKLGMHNYDEEVNKEAFIAIVFADAEILEHVWLLDTPGDMNSADEEDAAKALSAVEFVDGIIFVSTHTGFLKDSDLGFSSNIIRNKPSLDPNNPFQHLLFIQSHCHSELKKEDVEFVGKTAFKRVKRQLENLIFNYWVEDGFLKELPESDALSQRVQPFWRENDDYRLNTINQINDMAKFLCSQQEIAIDKQLKNAKNKVKILLRGNSAELNNKKKVSIERQKEVQEAKRKFENERQKLISEVNDLTEKCKVFRQNDLNGMKTYYDSLTSPEGLETLIRETYTDKKDAQSEIGSYLGQLISGRLENTLKKSGKAYSDQVNTLIEKWQKATPRISSIDINSVDGVDVDWNSFDAKAAFIGGLGGLGGLGAMALYVSTIASNLGAYIIVGKVAGVLVSLGLVGNVTIVTSFVAAIGGPITVGIFLATGIGYVIYRIFGGSWQKSLAKKVSEAIKKENVLSKINTNITTYWVKTAHAVRAGFTELDQEVERYSDKLLLESNNDYDVAELDKCINHLEKVAQLI